MGFLTARSGGHLVSLQCYVSPYDIFEEGTGTQLNLTDNNGGYTEGCISHVEVVRLHKGLVLAIIPKDKRSIKFILLDFFFVKYKAPFVFLHISHLYIQL